MSEHLSTDIIVVGTGLVGLSAAISLASANKKIVLINSNLIGNNKENTDNFNDINKESTQQNNNEKGNHSDWEARVYALTIESIAWLESIGVWDYVDKSRLGCINQMQLWTNERNAPLILKDSDAHLNKLGFIIENKNLMQAFWQHINALDITIVKIADFDKLDYSQADKITLTLNNAQTMTANLVVAADGASSWVRAQTNVGVTIKSFDQTAIVANFKIEKNHQNIANQWFKSHDTLALLPLPDNMVSMVWSVKNLKAAQLLSLNAVDLAQEVYDHSNGLLGRLTPIGLIQSFALNQQTAEHLIANRIVFVGDCAHQIHPLAGQGVNMGFRDVMQLQRLMTKVHTMQDIGEHSFLRRYERNRRADIVAINTLTSGLDWLFSRENSALNAGINWGFTQINKQLTVKRLLIQAATI